eukprot:6647779-Prymnesium_polylepis.1
MAARQGRQASRARDQRHRHPARNLPAVPPSQVQPVAGLPRPALSQQRLQQAGVRQAARGDGAALVLAGLEHAASVPRERHARRVGSCAARQALGGRARFPESARPAHRLRVQRHADGQACARVLRRRAAQRLHRRGVKHHAAARLLEQGPRLRFGARQRMPGQHARQGRVAASPGGARKRHRDVRHGHARRRLHGVLGHRRERQPVLDARDG